MGNNEQEGSNNIFQIFTTNETTYYLRFYIKYIENNQGSLNSNINIYLENALPHIYPMLIFSYSPNTIGSEWTKVTSTFTAPDNGNYIFRISQFLDPSGTDYFYLTDIYIGTSSTYCFNKGTEILCLRNDIETYIPIESIKKETDLVNTYKHGYKKIEGIYHSLFKNNPNDYKNSMYIMKKQENMTKDLIVTGGHSILVDNYNNDEIRRKHKKTFGSKLDPIDDKQLLLAGLSDSFTQIKGDDIYDIYHIVLEDEDGKSKRYGIWANGVLTESAYKNIL
jgi:hypothetical protein